MRFIGDRVPDRQKPVNELKQVRDENVALAIVAALFQTRRSRMF
jgi:hypothetical protein